MKKSLFVPETKLFWLSVSFRVCCALILCQTQFVPDEYWQCLEPAHRLAFGYGYLTWEWKQGLRSYLYPLIYALPYKALSLLRLDFLPILLGIAKCFEALITALADIYFFKFAKRVSGPEVGLWSLISYQMMWFPAYCTGRTLSNCLETTILIFVLYFYPWPPENLPINPGRRNEEVKRKTFFSWRYLALATVGTFVRPTSALFWGPLAFWHFWRVRRKVQFVLKTVLPVVIPVTFLCLYIDRVCYGTWEVTLWNFAKFNVLQGGSAFFGSHPFHWYLTAGLPVAVFTHLVPAVIGLARLTHEQSHTRVPAALAGLYVVVHSCLAHKEFRFLLPALPIFAFYSGIYFAGMCRSGQTARSSESKTVKEYFNETVPPRLKTGILPLMGAFNLALLLYTGLLHQRAPLDVMTHLSRSVRSRSEQNNMDSSILFLMPCHSTPFYSHLHQDVPMRFLTCEPNFGSVPNYIDEADIFHAAPLTWMEVNIPTMTPRPTHLVMYSWLAEKHEKWLAKQGFKLDKRFYHSFFFEAPRQSKYMDVYVRKQ